MRRPTSRSRSVIPASDLENLAEGQVLDGVALGQAAAGALGQCGLLLPTPRPDGLWRVQAAHVVGAVQVDGITVRVRPKIGAVKVLQLLARARGLRLLRLDAEPLPLDVEADLHALLALLFTEEAAHAFADGVLRGYRTEDQSLPVLRGRLRVREQQVRRFGQLLPLEVTVDEWTADTDENRRIRAATRALLSLPGVPPQVRARLQHIDRLLADVWLAPPGVPLAAWSPTRLNSRLHDLLRLADLVLEQQVFEHRSGEVRARGFVLQMEKLFEDVLLALLIEADDDVSVRGQQTYRLDTRSRITIKPDLLFRRGGRDIAVADTKYKFLDDSGRFSNADAYQLVTYCARLGLETGHLIYAAGPLPVEPFDIPTAGVTLAVHKVDLTRPLREIEQQVRTLRDRVIGNDISVAPQPR